MILPNMPLLKTIGTWDSMLNKGDKVRAIVIIFSKVFDTLNHSLLCKLKAYGFDTNALTFIQSYWSNRHQIINVGDRFSKWQKISTGVPQGSILWPTIFQHFFVMISSFLLKMLLYADGNTIYYSYKMAGIVINRLRLDFFDIQGPLIMSE